MSVTADLVIHNGKVGSPDSVIDASVAIKDGTIISVGEPNAMPPARETPAMTEEQQVKLEKDLEAARDRQEKGEKAAEAPEKSKKKRKPAVKKDTDAAAKDGAKTNP